MKTQTKSLVFGYVLSENRTADGEVWFSVSRDGAEFEIKFTRERDAIQFVSVLENEGGRKAAYVAPERRWSNTEGWITTPKN